MESIRKKTVSGFKWVAFSRYAQKGLSVLTFIVLARLLEPRVFGLFAMAFIIIDGLGLFKNMGIDSALVQRKDDVERASHTAFWMMPILGIVIYSALYIISPWAALIMEEPSLDPIIKMLGLIFILGAIENIPANLLSKELKFKELAIRELISSVLFSTSAVVFAIIGLGVWSLVYAYLIRRVSMFYFSWSLSNYRPKLVFDRKIAWDLFHFGKFIFVSSLVGFLIMNTDNFFVGKLMGAAALGYYALAFNLATLTTTHLSALVSRIMFPVYSKIQDNPEEIKLYTKKIMKALSLFSFPFGIVLMLFSAELIHVVYGAKWLPMVPALKVLAICSMLMPVLGTTESIFMACGKANWTFYLKIPVIIGMATLIPLFSWKWGLLGVGLAVTISKLCIFPRSFKLLDQMIGFKLREMFEAFRGVLIASSTMVIVGYTSKLMFTDVLGMFSFLIHGNLSVGAYIFVLHKLDKQIFADFKKFILNKGEQEDKKVEVKMEVEQVNG